MNSQMNYGQQKVHIYVVNRRQNAYFETNVLVLIYIKYMVNVRRKIARYVTLIFVKR